jgi:hypothetical protein
MVNIMCRTRATLREEMSVSAEMIHLRDWFTGRRGCSGFVANRLGPVISGR